MLADEIEQIDALAREVDQIAGSPRQCGNSLNNLHCIFFIDAVNPAEPRCAACKQVGKETRTRLARARRSKNCKRLEKIEQAQIIAPDTQHLGSEFRVMRDGMASGSALSPLCPRPGHGSEFRLEAR